MVGAFSSLIFLSFMSSRSLLCRFTALGLTAALGTAGCGPTAPAAETPAAPIAAAAPAVHAAPTVLLRGRRYTVELARSEEQRERGLMHRTHLPATQGMLFIFPSRRPLGFWMKDTPLPLDVLFFDADLRLVNFHSAKPCLAEPCPIYWAQGFAQYALELNAGQGKAMGLEVGDVLTLEGMAGAPLPE